MIIMIELAGLVFLVLISIGLLTRYVRPYLASMREFADSDLSPRRREHLAVSVDIWLPIALALPLLASAFSASTEVDQGSGWVALAGPIGAALMIAGATFLCGGAGAALESWRPMPWAVAGVLLVLLAACHHLTVVSGQLFFAAGAVLLWVLTPPGGGRDAEAAPAQEVRAGWALMSILLCGLAQGALLIYVIGADPATTQARAGVLIVVAGAALGGMSIALGAGRARGVRLAGGLSIMGVFFGTGGLGLSQLIHRASNMLHGEMEPIGQRIVRGFGAFSLEAALLLAFAAAAATQGNASPWIRRATGALLIAAGMFVVARFALKM